MAFKRLVTYIVIFNIVMSLLFVLSSVYVGNFISTQINEFQGFNGQGLVTIPYVETYVFTVSISHIIYYENGTVANLGTMPTTIPNHPFYIFWMAVIVNLVLLWVVYKKHR